VPATAAVRAPVLSVLRRVETSVEILSPPLERTRPLMVDEAVVPILAV
jgi:hypothetical protein